MPNEPIKVYNLGEGGVNVDTNPLRIASNEVLETQNATYDRTKSRVGGLTKRSGFARFHNTSLGGPVLGGIEAPYAASPSLATGAGGGGLPGDSGGTGESWLGTGAGPGDAVQFGAGGGGGGVSMGGGAGGGGVFAPVRIFNGKRVIAVGRADNTNPNHYGHGWYLSTQQLADQAIKLSIAQGTGVNSNPPAPGPPTEGSLLSTGIGGTGQGNIGQPASTIANGILYYQGSVDETQSTTPGQPTIRKTNGITDSLVCTIPQHPLLFQDSDSDTTWATSIETMVTKYGDGNYIYLTVVDSQTQDTSQFFSRIFQLNTVTNALTEVFSSENSQNATLSHKIVYALGTFMNRVFFGTWTGTAGQHPYWGMLQPDPTVTDGYNVARLTQDQGQSGHTTADITCMAYFNGSLYYGTEERGTTPTDFASVVAIPADPAAAVSRPLITSGGTAVTQNAIISMVVFKSKLYASWYNPTQTAVIYSTSDGVTWSAAYTAGGSADRQPFNLWVDPADGNPDTLYAFGSDGNHTSYWLTTQDGSTWTNRTTNLTGSLPGGDFTNSRPIPILLGFNQP